MDPKLTILFMLIACIIGLSHLGDLSFGRTTQRLRHIIEGRRKA